MGVELRNGNQETSGMRRAFLEKTLDRRVVAIPTYDEQGRNPCDEGIRIAELQHQTMAQFHLLRFSELSLAYRRPRMWKSRLSLPGRRTPWAQFFINRNNRETTDPNSHFPTIARQLANRSPDVQCVIYDRL